MKDIKNFLYILTSFNDVRPAASFEEWTKFMNTDRRIIKKTYHPTSRALVSTVFLGIDSGNSREGRAPALFETIIFAERLACDGDTWRATEYKGSLEQHKLAVTILNKEIEHRTNSKPEPKPEPEVVKDPLLAKILKQQQEKL